MLVTSLLALAALILIGICLKKETTEFDRLHPELDNPLESEAGSGLSEGGSLSQTGADGISAPLQDDLPPAEVQTETELPRQDRRLQPHRIIFVGDSRTIGMQNALKKLMPDDNCIFVGQVGEGCSWFLQEGEALMADAIREYPDAPVVLNFGVNDPDQTDQYLAAYSDMLETFPDTEFHFLSVNPIQYAKMKENGASEETLKLVTNTNVTSFNMAIQEAWPDLYLDSSSMLKVQGFETVDGLHFTEQTYLKIHRFAVRQLFP